MKYVKATQPHGLADSFTYTTVWVPFSHKMYVGARRSCERGSMLRQGWHVKHSGVSPSLFVEPKPFIYFAKLK